MRFHGSCSPWFICEESFTPRSRSLRPLTATVCAKLLTRQTRPPTEAAPQGGHCQCFGERQPRGVRIQRFFVTARGIPAGPQFFYAKDEFRALGEWIFRVDEQLSIDVCFTPESRQIADVSGAICYCAIGASDLLSYIYCPGIGTRPDFPSYGSQQLVHHCEIGGMVRSVRVTNPQPQR
jgi:hypothetical protein